MTSECDALANAPRGGFALLADRCGRRMGQEGGPATARVPSEVDEALLSTFFAVKVTRVTRTAAVSEERARRESGQVACPGCFGRLFDSCSHEDCKGGRLRNQRGAEGPAGLFVEPRAQRLVLNQEEALSATAIPRVYADVVRLKEASALTKRTAGGFLPDPVEERKVREDLETWACKYSESARRRADASAAHFSLPWASNQLEPSAVVQKVLAANDLYAISESPATPTPSPAVTGIASEAARYPPAAPPKIAALSTGTSADHPIAGFSVTKLGQVRRTAANLEALRYLELRKQRGAPLALLEASDGLDLAARQNDLCRVLASSLGPSRRDTSPRVQLKLRRP